MTNEQLAVLLQSYLDRLDIEVKNLEKRLPGSGKLERKSEWWHKEENRKRFHLLEGVDDKWEQRSTGKLVILEGLRSFSHDLSVSIEALVKDVS